MPQGIRPTERLPCPSVYILYRDENPYYFGKATGRLFSRLHSHSDLATDSAAQIVPFIRRISS